jgi:hypothetical protein
LEKADIVVDEDESREFTTDDVERPRDRSPLVDD